MIAKKNVRSIESHYEMLVNILGKKFIRQKIASPFDYITIASKGLNAHIIRNFSTHFKIPRDTTADYLNVSEPTVYRWIRDNKKLDRNLSIQLFELTDLFLYGIEVFENKDIFFKWLELSNTALGGLEPKELLEMPGGITKVKNILGRIEYGVYS
jgi:putative toxin-antitoxin system antitoxin component (TIGR02293 family)